MLKLRSVILIGHSLGARIVLEAAARCPKSVGAVVLLDGSRMYGGFSATQLAGDAITPEGLPKPAPLAAIFKALIGPHADEATRAYLMKNLSNTPAPLMQAAVDTIRDWDTYRADSAFAALRKDLPLLVIQSTYHDLFTPRYSFKTDAERTPYLDFIRAAHPAAIIRTLLGAGHFCMLERSDEVTGLIEGFSAGAFKP